MDNTLAQVGDHIEFKRNGIAVIGEVIRVKAGSVLAKISDYDAERLKLETPITVISHKHYKILTY